MMRIEKKGAIYLISSMRNVFMLLLGISLTSLTGCNQTEDFENLDVLTNKSWRLVSITQGGVDITDSCDLDDVLIFEDATSFDHNFGSLSCFNDDLTLSADTWKIIDNFTILRMKYKLSGDGTRGSSVEYWEITELSENILVLEDALAEDNDQIPEIKTYQN